MFAHGTGAPLDRVLAAARSVPTMLPPVRIAVRRYIDGAVHSATNADVLAGTGIDRAIVVTGSPDGAEGIDALWNAVLDGELRALTAAGVEAVVLARRWRRPRRDGSRPDEPRDRTARGASGAPPRARAGSAARTRGRPDQRTRSDVRMVPRTTV